MTIEKIPSMPHFRDLRKDVQKNYIKITEPKGKIAKHWERIFEEFKAIPNDEKPRKFQFMYTAIQELPKKFPKKYEMVLRRMYYQAGNVLERIATFDMPNDGSTADEISQTFLSAAEFYIIADEILGVWSDFTGRTINCLSAAGANNLAKNLASQVFPGSQLVTDGSPESLEAKALMKQAFNRREEFGARIYDVFLPPSHLN